MILLFTMAMVFYNAKGEYYSKLALEAMKKENPEKTLEYSDLAKSVFYSHTPSGIPVDSYSAWAYHQLHDERSRFEFSQKAYIQAPYNYEIISNYGMVLMANKKIKLAEELLIEANRINPRYDGAIFNLAILYYNDGQFEKAREWIDKVHYISEISHSYRDLIIEELEAKGK